MTTEQLWQLVNGELSPVARIDAVSGGMVSVLALDDGATGQVVTAGRLVEMIVNALGPVIRAEVERARAE